MAENYPSLTLCATVRSRLSDLVITDGQLIFVQDKHKIALDYNGKRVFYNQIEELATEDDRVSLLAPVTGQYYFVISTAVLWTYQGEWVQLTKPPEEIVFVGVEMPSLGRVGTLYVDKENKNISVWDEDGGNYLVVADKTEAIENGDIEALFL